MLRMYYSVASVFPPPTILTTTLETTASYIWEVFRLICSNDKIADVGRVGCMKAAEGLHN